MSDLTKITAKGTVLPMMFLKNKPYLQVAHRLVWFREEQPLAAITTEMVKDGDTYAVFKATITDVNGKLLATGHKREDAKSFPDYIEKAETGSIGRALAACGYGTQFDPSFDEGDRLADSPIAIPAKPQAEKKASKAGGSGVKTNTNTPATPTSTVTNGGSKSVQQSNTAVGVPEVRTETGALDPVKTQIGYAFTKLLEKGAITKEEFKEKYLGGQGLSAVTSETAVKVLSELRTNFKDLGV